MTVHNSIPARPISHALSTNPQRGKDKIVNSLNSSLGNIFINFAMRLSEKVSNMSDACTSNVYTSDDNTLVGDKFISSDHGSLGRSDDDSSISIESESSLLTLQISNVKENNQDTRDDDKHI